MRLYKPTKKGRPSTKDDPWWIELRDLHRRVRRFAAFADKEESRTFGKNIEKLISCKASGNPPGPESSAWVKDQPARLRDRFAALGLISTRQASAAKSLEDLLAEFEPTLLQGRGSRKQAALVMSRLRRIVAGCNAKRWEDLSRKAVAAFIEQQHQSGELSKRTCNFYIKHVRRFGRWLRRELALEASPFEDLQCKRFNKREDQVHERRALTAKQAKTLLQVAKNGPAILGMTGYQRYLAYKLAIETGLRRRELRALTPECFEFTARTVTVLGDRTKNKADAVLPLRAGTAAELREYCRHFTERATLFPIHDKSSKVMEADWSGRRARLRGPRGPLRRFSRASAHVRNVTGGRRRPPEKRSADHEALGHPADHGLLHPLYDRPGASGGRVLAGPLRAGRRRIFHGGGRIMSRYSDTRKSR